TFGEASLLFQRGHHGSTFAGNPLATAAGNAVLDEIESAGLIENSIRRGQELRDGIAALGSPLVGELRGRGLLIGVGLTAPVSGQLSLAALERGLIINSASPTSIRLAPPLILGDAEVAEFLELFAAALQDVS